MHRSMYAALGFGAGILVGWAVTADIYEKELKRKEAVYQADLKYRTQYVTNVYNPPSVSEGETFTNQDQMVVVPTDQIELLEDEEDSVPEGETEPETRSNLERIIKDYTPDPQTQADFVASSTVMPGANNRPPFIISREDYAFDDEGQSYAKITVTYYPGERVLLDDGNEVIKDIDRTVGFRNLTLFGVQSEDPNTVFVRNHRMETDFEVVREEENPLPLHVKYGMEEEEFKVNKAAGTLKLRPEDE